MHEHIPKKINIPKASDRWDKSIFQIEKMPQGKDKALELAVAGLLREDYLKKNWYFERIIESLGMDLDELQVQLDELDLDWEEGTGP